ncbi:Sortase Surface protein transpeptidase [candidate division SR1 bacterium RAAC1_SR1_1]|nr:Sortase Surface protein transpeptidase [candidate division SR1 bacterium RAAC1_SR1_1]
MKQKIGSRYILFFFSTMGFFLLSIIVSFWDFDNDEIQNESKEFPIVQQIPKEVPEILVRNPNEIRLEIPSIYVDAAVISVGLTKDGIMDSPNNGDDVGLFTLGKRPGENGTAVIAGHYGIWKDGTISVFHDINTLKKGDKLHIGDGKGGSVSFVVRESKIYDPNEGVSEVFLSNDGKSHLNLITCILDKKTKQYSKRLVVFTDKI